MDLTLKTITESNIGILLLTIIPNSLFYIGLINIDFTTLNMSHHYPFIIVFGSSFLIGTILFVRKYILKEYRNLSTHIDIVAAMDILKHQQLLAICYGKDGESVIETINRLQNDGTINHYKFQEREDLKRLLVDLKYRNLSLEELDSILKLYYGDK